MLKSYSGFAIIFLVVVPFSTVLGHQGHDHGEHDHHAANDDKKDEHLWHNSQNMSLTKLTGVDLKWVNTDPENIIMKMTSRTTGYVSVGFCPRWEGTMANCDIVIGWVAANSTPFLHDYHAKGNEAPIIDEQQDYQLISGTEIDGVTTITFQRKWDTDDPNDDADLMLNSVHIMYSWHPTDPSSFDEIPPHDKNGRGHTTTAVNLRNNSTHYNEHHGQHAHQHGTSAGVGNSFLFQNAGFPVVLIMTLKFIL